MIRLSSHDFKAIEDFEGKLTPEFRRKHGVYFTPLDLVLEVLTECLLKPWEVLLNQGLSSKKKLKEKFLKYKVLDPACGAGNFLFVAKYLLNHVVAPQIEDFGLRIPNENIFGIEMNGEICEVAYGLIQSRNIVCADALFTKWPETTIVVGNPPFLGGHRIRTELGDDYFLKLKKTFPNHSFKADYCTLWFQKAIQDCPKGTRVGFITTNSVTQNNSRRMSLDKVLESGGEFFYEVKSKPW